MQETQVQSLGQEDILGKEMATYSGILAWRILWTEEPMCYSPWDPKELDMTEQLSTEVIKYSRRGRAVKLPEVKAMQVCIPALPAPGWRLLR